MLIIDSGLIAPPSYLFKYMSSTSLTILENSTVSATDLIGYNKTINEGSNIYGYKILPHSIVTEL